MRKNKTRIKAAGALFLSINTQRFLFLLRSDDTYTGTWATVGGRVEKKETVIESLAREIKEEVGFLPMVRKTIPLDLFVSDDGRFEFHTFVCLVDKEFIPILNNEHSGYAWSDIKGFPKPLHPALYNALQSAELKSKISNILEVSQTDKVLEFNNFIVE